MSSTKQKLDPYRATNPMRRASPMRAPNPMRHASPRLVREPSPMRVPYTGRPSVSRASPIRSVPPSRDGTPTSVRERNIPRPTSIRTSEQILVEPAFQSRKEQRDPPPLSPVNLSFPPKDVKVSHKSYIDLSLSGSEIKTVPSPKKSREMEQPSSPFSYSSRVASQSKQKTPTSPPRALQLQATESDDPTISTDSPSTITCSVQSYKKNTITNPSPSRRSPRSNVASPYYISTSKSSMCSYVESARSDDETTKASLTEEKVEKSKGSLVSRRIDDILDRTSPRNRSKPSSTKSSENKATSIPSPKSNSSTRASSSGRVPSSISSPKSKTKPSSTRSSSSSRSLSVMTSPKNVTQVSCTVSAESNSSATVFADYQVSEKESQNEMTKTKLRNEQLESENKKYKENSDQLETKVHNMNRRLLELECDSSVENSKQTNITELKDIIEHTKKSYTQLAKSTEQTSMAKNRLEAEVKELRLCKENNIQLEVDNTYMSNHISQLESELNTGNDKLEVEEKELQDLKRGNLKLESDLSYTSKRMKESERKLSLSNERLEEQDTIIDDMRNDHDGEIADMRNYHDSAIADMTKQLEETKDKCHEIMDKSATTKRSNSELEMEVNALGKQVKELQLYEEKSWKLESDLELLMREGSQIEDKLYTSRSKAVEQETVIEELKKQSSDAHNMRQRIAELSQDLAKSDSDDQKIEELKDVVEHTKKSYTQLAKSHDISNDRNRKLETELKTLLQCKEESAMYKTEVDEQVAELTDAIEYLHQGHSELNESNKLVNSHNTQLKNDLSDLKETLALTNKVKEQFESQLKNLHNKHEEVIDCYKQLQTQAQQNEKQYDANFSDCQQLFENKLQEKSKLESDLRHKLENANKAVRELRDAGLKRGKQISALLKEKNSNQNFISELQSSKEKESLELQSSLNQVRQHFKIVESQYVDKLVLLREQFDELRENHLIERETMAERENELGNEVDQFKQFVCEKDEKLLQMETKEHNLLQDIENITTTKNSIELAKCQAEEYHNSNMSMIKNELSVLQSKLDESHQNERDMQNNISELKSATESLQFEMETSTDMRSKLEQEKSILNDEILDLKSKLEEKYHTLTELESQFEDFKDAYVKEKQESEKVLEASKAVHVIEKQEYEDVLEILKAIHVKEKLESEEALVKEKQESEEELEILKATHAVEKQDSENAIETLKASQEEKLNTLIACQEDELKAVHAKEKQKSEEALVMEKQESEEILQTIKAAHVEEKQESENAIETLKTSHEEKLNTLIVDQEEELKTLMTSHEENLNILNVSQAQKNFKLQALDAELDILKEAYTKARTGLKKKEADFNDRTKDVASLEEENIQVKQELAAKRQVLDELRESLGSMERFLLEKDAEIVLSEHRSNENEKAYENELSEKTNLEAILTNEKAERGILEVNVSVLESDMALLKQKLENISKLEALLTIEKEQRRIVEVNVSVLESDMSFLQQRLENISVTKALFSNDEATEKKCADDVKSMDDILSNIEAMCDDKNTMIQQLLEELETVKNVNEGEAEEKNTYVTEIEELLKEAKFSLNFMKSKASELAKTLDDANSNLNEKESRIVELEEHVKLVQLNSDSLNKKVSEVSMSLERAHCTLNDKENEVLDHIEDKSGLEEDLLSSKMLLVEKEEQHSCLEKEMIVKEKFLLETTERLSSSQNESRSLEKEMIVKEKALLETTERLASSQNESRSITEKVLSLSNTLDEVVTMNNEERAVFDSNIKDYESVMGELEEELQKCNAQLAQNDEDNLQVKLQESEALKDNLAHKLASLEDEIKEAKCIITDVELVKDELEIQKNNLRGKLQATELSKEDLEHNFEALEEELIQTKCTITDMRLEKDGLSEKMSKLEMEKGDLQSKLQETETFQAHLQDKLDEAAETINTLKEHFGSLEIMVADKDSQLLALTESQETSHKERFDERDLLQGQLSAVTNELVSLQKETGDKIEFLQNEYSTLTNELETKRKERGDDQSLFHDQFLDIVGQTQYLEQTLEDRNVQLSDYTNKLEDGVEERETHLTHLSILGIKMTHLDEILREKDEQLSDLSSQLDSTREGAATELQSLHQQLKELIRQSKEIQHNKDVEITTLEDILLEKGVHVSDLSTQIEDLKQEIEEKEKIHEESIHTHKQKKHALQDIIDQANILQEQLELRLEQIIDDSTRTRKNLLTVTKEASKSNARFEEKINELNTTIGNKNDLLKQVESTLTTCEVRNGNLQEQVSEIESLLNELEVKASSMKSSLESQIVRLKFSITEKDCQLIELAQELDNITESQAKEQRTYIKAKRELEQSLHEATSRLSEATELSMKLSNELHAIQSVHSLEKENQQETMQSIISELMSASKTIFGKDDQGFENVCHVDSSANMNPEETADSLSAFIGSNSDFPNTSQADPDYAALKSPIGLTEDENEASQKNVSDETKTLSDNKQESINTTAVSPKANVINIIQKQDKPRTDSAESFESKINQVETKIDDYVDNFSTLVTNLSNITANAEVDVDVTKQKEERSIINNSISNANKKTSKARVDLQATAEDGSISSEHAYNVRENTKNLNTPLSIDEYEGFDSINQEVEVFLQVSTSGTEYGSSNDQGDLKEFNTNSGFSSELLESNDSYTDDSGSYTSGSV